MAQFSVYRNPNIQSNQEYPYLLDIQNDLLSTMTTRVVIPLSKTLKPVKHLNPIFQIEGNSIVLSVAEMAGVPVSMLENEITNLKEYHDEIINTIDFLINGF